MGRRRGGCRRCTRRSCPSGRPRRSCTGGPPSGDQPGRRGLRAQDGLSWGWGRGPSSGLSFRLQTLRTSEGLLTERGPGTSWVLPSRGEVGAGSAVVCEQPELAGRRWKQPGLDGARRTGRGGGQGRWKLEGGAGGSGHPPAPRPVGPQKKRAKSCREGLGTRSVSPPARRQSPGSSQGCKSLSCRTLGCLGLSLPICELGVTAVSLGQEGDGAEGGALSLAPREPWAAVNPCAALGSLQCHARDEASPTSPAPHPRGPRGVSRPLVPAPSRCCAGPRETETHSL